MRLPRMTIRRWMIAVAVVACILTLLESPPAGFVLIWVVCGVVQAHICWERLRGRRRRAAWSFGITSLATSASVASLSIYALNTWGMLGMFLASLCGIPLTLGFGAAWADTSTRPDTATRRSPILAWALVLVLGILPLTILLTSWPFHLAFLASRPAMDRLADRIAGGQRIASPEWAGLFRVVATAVDPSSGNICLVIDLDPSGRSGFVRLGAAPKAPTGRPSGPFYNVYLDLKLCAEWKYECED
jgi:hypothetical protein